MTTTVTIITFGCKLKFVVTYNYISGEPASYNSPGYNAEYDLIQVCLPDGTNVLHDMTDEEIDEIIAILKDRHGI